MFEANGTTGVTIPAWEPVVDRRCAHWRRIPPARASSRAASSRIPGHIAIGAVDPTTGAFLPFAYQGPPTFMPPPPFPYRPFQVLQFAQDGNTLFVAGTGNGGTALSINMEDGTVNYMEGFNGNVVGIGVADGVVYMGGHFTDYCGPIMGNNFVCSGLPGSATRDKLAAVDEATGQVLSPWNPAVNTNLGIEALAAGGTSLAVGGEFTKIGGVNQQHFARFTE